jgi:hypothetical protein
MNGEKIMIGLMVHSPKVREPDQLNFDHLDLDYLMQFDSIWMFESLELYRQQKDFYRKALEMVEEEMVRCETR